MARKYIEDTIEALYDYLNSNLETYLSTIRTERNSDFPAKWQGLKKRVSLSKDFPKITIYKDYTDYDYAYEEALLIEPWLMHNVIIHIEHLSSSIDEINETLMRYVEALNRLQEADDTFGGNFVHVRYLRDNWGMLFQNQKDKKSIQAVEVSALIKVY